MEIHKGRKPQLCYCCDAKERQAATPLLHQIFCRLQPTRRCYLKSSTSFNLQGNSSFHNRHQFASIGGITSHIHPSSFGLISSEIWRSKLTRQKRRESIMLTALTFCFGTFWLVLTFGFFGLGLTWLDLGFRSVLGSRIQEREGQHFLGTLTTINCRSKAGLTASWLGELI